MVWLVKRCGLSSPSPVTAVIGNILSNKQNKTNFKWVVQKMSNTFFSVQPCAVVLLDSSTKPFTLPGFTPSSSQLWSPTWEDSRFSFLFWVKDRIQGKGVWTGLKWIQKECWMMPGKLAQTLEFRQCAVTHLGLDVRGTAGAEVE